MSQRFPKPSSSNEVFSAAVLAAFLDEDRLQGCAAERHFVDVRLDEATAVDTIGGKEHPLHPGMHVRCRRYSTGR